MMEDFNNFIFQLFERFGYESKAQIDGQHLFKHKEKVDYWIVSNGLWAIENQPDLFVVLTKEHKADFPLADKNTSLLLLMDTELETLNEDDIRFVEIENDPLYFKKYVLPYTQDTYHRLLEQKSLRGVSFIEDLIMEDVVFENLKSNMGYAKLLYTIVHKLPFIPVQLKGQKEYHNELNFSSGIEHLAGRVNAFPIRGEDQDAFMESLIKEYEDEEN